METDNLVEMAGNAFALLSGCAIFGLGFYLFFFSGLLGTGFASDSLKLPFRVPLGIVLLLISGGLFVMYLFTNRLVLARALPYYRLGDDLKHYMMLFAVVLLAFAAIEFFVTGSPTRPVTFLETIAGFIFLAGVLLFMFMLIFGFQDANTGNPGGF